MDGGTQGTSLRPEIEEIFLSVGLSEHMQAVLSIGERFIVDRMTSYRILVSIDQSIPGLGLHNINEQTEIGSHVGIYKITDRAIFRGIQYVEAHLGSNIPEWITRTVVTESCYHVESCLKRRFQINGPLSVGMILNKRKARIQEFDKDLLDILRNLNSAIYNKAKHTIEDVKLDAHMFSIADAIAVYLACRVIGARLMTGMNLTTKYGKPVIP